MQTHAYLIMHGKIYGHQCEMIPSIYGFPCSLPLIRHGRRLGARALFCCHVFGRRIRQFLFKLPFHNAALLQPNCLPQRSTPGNSWVCMGKHLWSFATQHLPIFDHPNLLVCSHDHLGPLTAKTIYQVVKAYDLLWACHLIQCDNSSKVHH
jgi:hypothetical protein